VEILKPNVLTFALRLKVLLPVRESSTKATEDAMLTLSQLQRAIMLTTTTAGLQKKEEEEEDPAAEAEEEKKAKEKAEEKK